MKGIKIGIMCICSTLMLTGCVATKNVEWNQLNSSDSALIAAADSRWDGVTVPAGEQGKLCGGMDPHFPSLTFNLEKLNTTFNSRVVGIKMYAYDVDWRDGHHGKWSYDFDANASTFVSPEIPSETMKMPEGVNGIATHTAGSKFTSGYYLAPSSCVAGGGHKYFTDIIFSLENGENVRTTFSQGKY